MSQLESKFSTEIIGTQFNAAKRGVTQEILFGKSGKGVVRAQTAHHPRPSSVTNGGGQQHLRPDDKPRRTPSPKEGARDRGAAEGRSSDRPSKCRGPVPTFRPCVSTRASAHASASSVLGPLGGAARAAAEGNLCSYRAAAGRWRRRRRKNPRVNNLSMGRVDVVWINARGKERCGENGDVM